MIITGTILKQIVPNLEIKRANFLAEKIDFIAPTYKMNNVGILHEFIANLAHESCGFRLKEENLNYSAAALLKTWPKWFTPQTAKQYERQPAKIANYVYNRRELGNLMTGDGWLFRGGGFIQLTGRAVYGSYQNFTAFNDITELVKAVRTDDYWALDSAFWFFAVHKNLIKAAIDDKFLSIVKSINGGYNGLTDRQEYYERAKRYLVAA